MTKRMDLAERLLEYAAEIIKLIGVLPKNIVGSRIGDQLLRSGTSVGANYEEAQGAESRKDFVHKLQIALKELRESNYWLRLLAKAKITEMHHLNKIIDESNELKSILSKAVITAKRQKENV